MMDKKSFTNKVIELLKDRYGQNYTIEAQNIEKNNGIVRSGIIVKNNENDTCSPVVYIDRFYEEYTEHTNIVKIIDEIIDCLSLADEFNNALNISDFESWEYAKDRLDICIVSKEKNMQMLKNLVWIETLDLAVYVIMRTDTSDDAIHSFKVSKEFTGIWNVSEEEIVKAAFYNAWSKNQYKAIGLDNIIIGMILSGRLPATLLETTRNLIVLTNKYGVNGAAAILDKNFMQAVYDRIGEPLYILPSSIHECIALKADASILELLKVLVADANKEINPPEEILTNNVYYFDGENLSIAMEGACENV